MPSLTNEARFLTLRSMPASWPLTSIRLGLSFIGSEDQSSNSATLAREVTLREDGIALRALSMECAHLRLNFLLIAMGWYWSLPDAFAEQGGGDVLQNRIRAKLQVCQTLIFVCEASRRYGSAK